MNNRRLLTGLLVMVLSGTAVCSYGQTVMSLDDLFEYAESHSAQLRPAFTNQDDGLKCADNRVQVAFQLSF